MSNHPRPDEITHILQRELAQFATQPQVEEVGSVLQASDGVVRIHGLDNVQAGEKVTFDNGLHGLALNLEENHVGVVVLGEGHSIKEGDLVKRTGKMASIAAGPGFLGRIVNTLGQPIDGQGPIAGPLVDMPLERGAPEVIYRQPVAEPLQTGVKAIDAMIPIGHGQRELIIGDRQTGKSTLAIDTILHQRSAYEQGRPTHCIYVAIGQKASTIAYIHAILAKHGAMPYTTIVAAPADTPASLQVLAPFAGVALGEFFRDTGQRALVVYDDLSKQATAYREIALLLRRPPGREAYPGDIFYLHARLLERAAKIIHNDALAQKMNDLPASLAGQVRGGGSLTALPIVETQEGDVAAYIPTNVISITDGQIFLESNLFNAGIRPAINVGISVSRVGGAAQIGPIKEVASSLKLDLAQFRELESFAKFGSDLDPATRLLLERGRRSQEVLKQGIYQPMPIGQQVATLYATSQGHLDVVPLDKVSELLQAYLERLAKEHEDLFDKIAQGTFDAPVKELLDSTAQQVAQQYTATTAK